MNDVILKLYYGIALHRIHFKTFDSFLFSPSLKPSLRISLAH